MPKTKKNTGTVTINSNEITDEVLIKKAVEITEMFSKAKGDKFTANVVSSQELQIDLQDRIMTIFAKDQNVTLKIEKRPCPLNNSQQELQKVVIGFGNISTIKNLQAYQYDLSVFQDEEEPREPCVFERCITKMPFGRFRKQDLLNAAAIEWLMEAFLKPAIRRAQSDKKELDSTDAKANTLEELGPWRHVTKPDRPHFYIGEHPAENWESVKPDCEFVDNTDGVMDYFYKRIEKPNTDKTSLPKHTETPEDKKKSRDIISEVKVASREEEMLLSIQSLVTEFIKGSLNAIDISYKNTDKTNVDTQAGVQFGQHVNLGANVGVKTQKSTELAIKASRNPMTEEKQATPDKKQPSFQLEGSSAQGCDDNKLFLCAEIF